MSRHGYADDDELDGIDQRVYARAERKRYRSAKKGLARNDLDVDEDALTEHKRYHGYRHEGKKRNWMTRETHMNMQTPPYY